MSKFVPGQSGNLKGRPKGVSKRLQFSKLLEPHAEVLVAKAVELAVQGDVNSLRLCIERLIPKAKEEAIEFNLPEGNLSSSDTLLKLNTKIMEQVARGEISLEESERLSALVDSQSKLIQVTTIAAQIEEVQRILKARKKITAEKKK